MAPLLFLWIASVDTRWMMQDKEKKKKMFKNGLGGRRGGDRGNLKLSEHLHLIQMLI